MRDHFYDVSVFAPDGSEISVIPSSINEDQMLDLERWIEKHPGFEIHIKAFEIGEEK